MKSKWSTAGWIQWSLDIWYPHVWMVVAAVAWLDVQMLWDAPVYGALAMLLSSGRGFGPLRWVHVLLVVFSNEDVRGTVAVNFHVKENYGSIKKTKQTRERGHGRSDLSSNSLCMRNIFTSPLQGGQLLSLVHKGICTIPTFFSLLVFFLNWGICQIIIS